MQFICCPSCCYDIVIIDSFSDIVKRPPGGRDAFRTGSYRIPKRRDWPMQVSVAQVENLITLGQYEAVFPSTVKPEVHAYVTGGSASELSLRRNRAALERIAVEQRVGMDVRTIDLSTTFLGMDLPLPFTVCPMGGMPQLWPQGDVEMARGATAGG